MYNKPDLIYCFNKHNCVNRSKQLMQPLIDTGIPHNCKFNDTDKDTEAIVEELFNASNDSKTLLICWEHKSIPLLIQLIGDKIAKNTFKNFKYWATNPQNPGNGKNDDSLYSMTVIINYDNNTLKCINQSDDFDKKVTVLKPADKYTVQYSISWN